MTLNYLQAHKVLWASIVEALEDGDINDFNDYLVWKKSTYKEICRSNGYTTDESNCFLCGLIYNNGFNCNGCNTVFLARKNDGDCLCGLLSLFIDSIAINKERAIAIAKIIRDIGNGVDLSIFGEDFKK